MCEGVRYFTLCYKIRRNYFIITSDFYSPKCPDRLWVPPSFLFNGYRVLSLGVKRPGREVNHSAPFNHLRTPLAFIKRAEKILRSSSVRTLNYMEVAFLTVVTVKIAYPLMVCDAV